MPCHQHWCCLHRAPAGKDLPTRQSQPRTLMASSGFCCVWQACQSWTPRVLCPWMCPSRRLQWPAGPPTHFSFRGMGSCSALLPFGSQLSTTHLDHPPELPRGSNRQLDGKWIREDWSLQPLVDGVQETSCYTTALAPV